MEDLQYDSDDTDKVITWLQRSINYYVIYRELAEKYKDEALEDNSKEIIASTFRAQKEECKKEVIKHASLLVNLNPSEN